MQELTRSSTRPSWSMLAASLVLTIAIPASANAAPRVLQVANNGIDGVNCGSRSTPCRSINQAMANAANGDTIRVGPGRYGDLNADGVLAGPGEELEKPSSDGGGCMICVTKSLRFLSTHGAAATVMNGVPGGELAVVSILQNNVTFGLPDRGFTLTGSFAGLRVRFSANVRVAGNLALNNVREGFIFFDDPGGPYHIHDNIAVGNDTGIRVISVARVPGGVFLRHNVAIGNTLAGFRVISRQTVATDNESYTNGTGFIVNEGLHQFRRNTAVNNLAAGFDVESTNEAALESHFERNTSIGNGGPGFTVRHSLPTTSFVENHLNFNNIYGNDLSSPTRNCGVFNTTTLQVDATNNFWGLPTGPGADPADNGGGTCDQNGSVTVVSPFATTPQ